MLKFLVIILLVCVVFHLNNGGVFDNGADKLSKVDVLRGAAHFKAYAFPSILSTISLNISA